jgi:hypothetical protein
MSDPRHQPGIRNVINRTSWLGILLDVRIYWNLPFPDPEKFLYAEVFLARKNKFPKGRSIIDQEEFNQWYSRIPTEDKNQSLTFLTV